VVLEKWIDRCTNTCQVPLEAVWAAVKAYIGPSPNFTTYICKFYTAMVKIYKVSFMGGSEKNSLKIMLQFKNQTSSFYHR